MANQGSKKRLEENAKRLKLLQYIIFISVALYSVVNLYLNKSSATWWTWTGFILCLVVYGITYSGIAAFAKPVFDERGELIDGGADLNMKGMCSYYHDFLYVTGAVLVLTCISAWFWILFLIPPGFALYKLCANFIVPWFMSSDKDPVIDEATRKKMERAEKRAERRRNKW
jgi:hypothetical protein